VGYRLTDPATAARELGFGRSIGLNSIRLPLELGRTSPTYWAELRALIRTADSLGYTVQPVLLDAHDEALADPAALTAPETLEWVCEAVQELREEAGILFWDLLNEPTALPYLTEAAGACVPMADPEGYAKREADLCDALRTLLAAVRQTDGNHPVTVGHRFACDLELLADELDLLSFHDAHETRAHVSQCFELARRIGDAFGKPVLCTRAGDPTLGSTYDMELELCASYGLGYVLPTLMLSDDAEGQLGIFYADGTVRDPAIPAAVLGYFRNRNAATRIRPNANRENRADRAIAAMDKALRDPNAPASDLLTGMDLACNLLESCELVAMNELPTARLSRFWQEENVDRPATLEMRKMAYSLAMLLKELCQIR
jgi:hypothetical protein